MKNSRGQSLVEALFVVVFTTIIMFCFLQICIMVVDDMTLNEAAFVAMRSATVTKAGAENKGKEAEKWARNYLFLFYPMVMISDTLSEFKGSFAFSDYNEVFPYFKEARNLEERDESHKDKPVTVSNNNLGYDDYAGQHIYFSTTKIYYYTRVMFASIVAKGFHNKQRGLDDYILGGRKRYNSSRSRMVYPPGHDYYYKAYPDADKFKDYSLKSMVFGDD